MENGNFDAQDKKMESVYSTRIRAGKRRTYFFDVRATRGNDFFITITESRKRFDNNGYDRHKIFLYKEDFNKFKPKYTELRNFINNDKMDIKVSKNPLKKMTNMVINKMEQLHKTPLLNNKSE